MYTMLQPKPKFYPFYPSPYLKSTDTIKSVIFFDIDGVLNNDNTEDKRDGLIKIDEENILNLQHIVETTGSILVMTAFVKKWWRKYNKELQDPIGNYIDNKFEEYNLKIFEKTNDYSYDGESGIVRWLKEHRIFTYVVLNDRLLQDYNYDVLNHLVLTDRSNGLTYQNAVDAIEILNKV